MTCLLRRLRPRHLFLLHYAKLLLGLFLGESDGLLLRALNGLRLQPRLKNEGRSKRAGRGSSAALQAVSRGVLGAGGRGG